MKTKSTAKPIRPARSAQHGFTLIELLAVIVIIGVLMAAIGGTFMGKAESAKASTAKIEMSKMAQSLDLFKLEVGRYPTAQEGLEAMVKNPGGLANWNGPYLTTIKDPWGNDYKYSSPGPNNAPYEIKSLGSDGKEGGEGPAADITKS